MKKKSFLFLVSLFGFMFLASSLFAQSPFGINYQAIARDASGNPMANQTIAVGFKIHMGSAGGSVSYSESPNLNTNPFGLFSWVIGSSSGSPGFDTIAWGKHKYFLEVIVNGNSMGTTQFVSVPYALHAHTADSVKNISLLSPWIKSGGDIYPATLSDNVGIGLASPSGKLSVLVSGNNNTADAFNVGHQGLGHAAVFAQSNPANDSACLVSYTTGKAPAVFGINFGAGHGGVFSANGDTAALGDGLIGSANGHGKAVFGLQTGRGYGGAFWINNANNDSSAVAGITNGTHKSMGVYGINTGLGWGGFFQINNSANSSDALYATTSGTGNAGNFNGKLKTVTFQVTSGAGISGQVLTSDASGNASWQNPPSGGGSGSGFSNMQVFTSTTASTFTITTGITKIMVEVWGGGGAGASANNSVPTTGGGGGGYAKGIFNVTPLAILTVSVGTGGTPGTSGSAGGNGGTSSVTGIGVNISATGGTGGNTTGGGGGGGNGSSSFFNITGGSGVPGGTGIISNGGMGASGGAGGLGGTPGAPSGAGIAPGGGGGGGNPNSTMAGGAGALGRVVIWW